MEEGGIKSSRKRRIQGILVGHRDRTRATPHIAKSGIVRNKSRTRQTLSDVQEPMNLENWFGDPANGDLVACDDYKNKIGRTSAQGRSRIEVDKESHS